MEVSGIFKKNLGMIVTNKNCIREIKSRLSSGNNCYHLVQNLLYSRLLSKILSDFYGCELGPRTVREEHRMRVFENRVLRRIFGPEREEVAGG
jgi:hypothetical protein